MVAVWVSVTPERNGRITGITVLKVTVTVAWTCEFVEELHGVAQVTVRVIFSLGSVIIASMRASAGPELKTFPADVGVTTPLRAPSRAAVVTRSSVSQARLNSQTPSIRKSNVGSTAIVSRTALPLALPILGLSQFIVEFPAPVVDATGAFNEIWRLDYEPDIVARLPAMVPAAV
jgi:hypothetical protein